MRNSMILFFILVIFGTVQATAFAEEKKPMNPIQEKVKQFVEEKKKEAPSVSVEALKALMDKDEFFFEVLDVRTTEEYTAGRIADAVHVDRNKLEWVTPKKFTDPNVPIFVYCKGGNRGALATLRLIEMGYTQVKNITGGIKSWADAGYLVYNDLGEFKFTEGGFGKKPE